jgi:signal transduction histidine kinase
MSHELRTPLNAIIGFSSLLMSGELPRAKTEEYAEDINTGGRRLLVILNDIVDMARIDAGAVELDEDEVSLREIAGQAVSKLAEETPAHGKTIVIHDGGRDIRVRGDRKRLRQVITHLVSNAAKFTKADARIDITFETSSDGVSIVVRDNGAGIPKDKLSLVLEPFGQAESVYARSHGGVGLGLPIVKSLVELHGGVFTLSSMAGAGTEARVHLPASRVLTDNTDRLVLAS